MSLPIEIKHLSKTYRKKIALSDLSFNIQGNEIVGLLGANGTGKSTLIKSILDLVEIDAGEISIFGQSHHSSAARGGLAYLSEQFRPPHFSTGNDVLKLLAGVEGIKFSMADITRHCEMLALDESVLKAPCKSYSKGMRQKLGLIACLLAEKRLLMLDEPMSGLDPLARRLFKDRLLEQRERNRSVLFSTHLLEDIESVCDRVIILDAGRIKFIGGIDELFKASGEDSLEAAFLGLITST